MPKRSYSPLAWTDPEPSAGEDGKRLPPMRTECVAQDWPCRDGFSMRPIPPGATREALYCATCRSRTCPYGKRPGGGSPFACDPYPGIHDWVPVRMAMRVAGVSRSALSGMVQRDSLIGVIAGPLGELFVSLGQVLARYEVCISYEEAMERCRKT